MPAWYVHVISNLIIFVPILSFLNISWDFLLLILAWGVLIDLDHIPYYSYKLRTLNFFKIVEFSDKDFKSDTVHFYPLHTLEFFLIFGGIIYLVDFDLKLVLLLLAGIVHWILDGMRHYLHHKNFHWLEYYSTFYYLSRRQW